MSKKHSTKSKQSRKANGADKQGRAELPELLSEEIKGLAQIICADGLDLREKRTAAFMLLMHEIQDKDEQGMNTGDIAWLASLAAYGESDFGSHSHDCLIAHLNRDRGTGEVAWDSVRRVVQSHRKNVEERSAQ